MNGKVEGKVICSGMLAHLLVFFLSHCLKRRRGRGKRRRMRRRRRRDR